MITDQGLGRWSDMNTAAMDIIEIPIEPGQKISKILIKPTESGIKAMIAQCGRPSPSPELSASREGMPPSPEKAPEESPMEVEECGKARGERLDWPGEMFDIEAANTRNDGCLVDSALYFHQEVEQSVECAVLFEPHGAKDGLNARRSDEMNQSARDSKKMGEEPVSYGVLHERTDSIVKTFKTMSEPTWNEKKKIIQQQQLKDNINSLLEQFMFLEAEDIIDFAVSHSKFAECEKQIHFGKSSGLRELSREVSPEILVNIKPFKEQVSDDFLAFRGSPTRMGQAIKDDSHAEEARKAARAEEMRRRKEGKGQCSCRGLRGRTPASSGTVTDKSFLRFIETPSQSMSIMDQEESEAEEEEECKRGVSLHFKYNTLPKTPTCTLWGLYKTYSGRRTSFREAGGEFEKLKLPKEEAKENVESVNEFLDNLDDTDHDLVFQRNLSQFRKKITSVPRFDSSNSSINTVVSQQRKFPRTEPPKWKKPDTFRFEFVRLWKHERKWGKVLENNCLLLSEYEFLSRTLATRIEAGTLECPQTAREVFYMLESNRFTVMLKKVPTRFEGKLRAMEALRVPREAEAKEHGAIAAVIAIHGYDFCGKICTLAQDMKSEENIPEAAKLFPNTTKCYYILPETWFGGFGQKQILKLMTRNQDLDNFPSWVQGIIQQTKKQKETQDTVFKGSGTLSSLEGETLCRKPSAKSKEILVKDEANQTDVKMRTKKKFETFQMLYQPASSVVQVLSGSLCDYGILVYDNTTSSDAVSSKQSETAGHVEAEASNSSCPVAEQKAPDAPCESVAHSGSSDRVSKKIFNSDFSIDGFKVIYNNSRDSLNDDEEGATKTVFTGGQFTRKRSFIFATDELQNRIADRKKNFVWYSYEKPTISETPEIKSSRTIRHKTNSCPVGNMVQAEYLGKEQHRPRKSLIFPRELEKEGQIFKKRRLSFDKVVDMRRTGSTVSESTATALGKDMSYVQKKLSLTKEETCKSFVFPEELKGMLVSERHSVEKKKMFVLENCGGVNMKKEIIAAFNSIKETNAAKGEVKGGKRRMSLVIMLSRK